MMTVPGKLNFIIYFNIAFYLILIAQICYSSEEYSVEPDENIRIYNVKNQSIGDSSKNLIYHTNSLGGRDEGNVSTIIEESVQETWQKTIDTVANVVMGITLVALMLGMGCATDWKEVVRHMWPPKGLLVGMTSQFLLMPACGTLFSWMFGLSPSEAMGVLIVCCSPGGAVSNFFAFWVDGDLPLSIVMTVFSTILAFVGMPFNLWLYSKIWSTQSEQNLVVPYLNIVMTLMLVVVPATIGMLIMNYKGKLAKKITLVSSIIGWLGITTSCVMWTFLYYKNFIAASGAIYLTGGLLPITAFLIGFGLAKLLSMSNKTSRTIGIETSTQNIAVALSIIMLSFSDMKVRISMLLFPAVFVSMQFIQIFIFITAFQVWKRYRASRAASSSLPLTTVPHETYGLPRDVIDEKHQ